MLGQKVLPFDFGIIKWIGVEFMYVLLKGLCNKMSPLIKERLIVKILYFITLYWKDFSVLQETTSTFLALAAQI